MLIRAAFAISFALLFGSPSHAATYEIGESFNGSWSQYTQTKVNAGTLTRFQIYSRAVMIDRDTSEVYLCVGSVNINLLNGKLYGTVTPLFECQGILTGGLKGTVTSWSFHTPADPDYVPPGSTKGPTPAYWWHTSQDKVELCLQIPLGVEVVPTTQPAFGQTLCAPAKIIPQKSAADVKPDDPLSATAGKHIGSKECVSEGELCSLNDDNCCPGLECTNASEANICEVIAQPR
jgi:hypothetical protein